MGQNQRYESRREAAWCDLINGVDALWVDFPVASPLARQQALAAVARALREPPASRRLPLARGILAELSTVARTPAISAA